tara:strand:- start:432 stop:881 length:450 start_codon:yes stop_codon:yes gene_type:complete
MAEVTIGLGIVLSLLLSETLGVTAGGIIVPGYIALYIHQPFQVIITLLVAVIVWAIIQILGKRVFLYGKRRIVLALILGFFFGFLSRNFIFFSQDMVSLAVIGNIIPGLIANWMDRQGVIRTISVVILTAVMVKLAIILIFGGALFEQL